jgi:hypothetical protein
MTPLALFDFDSVWVDFSGCFFPDQLRSFYACDPATVRRTINAFRKSGRVISSANRAGLGQLPFGGSDPIGLDVSATPRAGQSLAPFRSLL